MEIVKQVIDVFLHLDVHLSELVGTMGPWLYLLLFAVIFCETGLVVTPVLPGDSLLFAAGALVALPGSPLNLPLLIVLLIAAAVLGDAVNYAIGYRVGPRVFAREDSWLLSKKHLWRTQRFYEKYGGKTIILARFMPFIRTFAPFVAGIGQMRYGQFAFYNVIGGIAWVLICTLAGYFFGNIPAVKNNFSYVILAIVVVSVLPAVAEFLLTRRKQEETPAVAEVK